MPVVWSTASCNPPTPTGKDDDALWRSCLIDSSGIVGLSKVTEDNVEEWLWRLEFLRRVLSQDVGCLVYNDGGTIRREPAKPADIRRWVGLWTNWSNYTRPAFVKRWVEDVEKDCNLAVSGALSREADENPKRKRKRRVKA